MIDSELIADIRAHERQRGTLLRKLHALLKQYQVARQRLLAKQHGNPEIEEWIIEMDKKAAQRLVTTAKTEEETAEARLTGAHDDPDVRALRLKHYHDRTVALTAQLESHAAFLEDAIRLMKEKEASSST